MLRPNLISIYKGKDESQLRHLITLSDLTAVAPSKDPKYKGKHIFGLYSPSRNYHLEAETAKSASEWVELIRREARIEEEETMVFGSSTGHRPPHRGVQEPSLAAEQTLRQEEARLTSSSPEPIDVPTYTARTRDGIRIPDINRQSMQYPDYSATDIASYSDFSDAIGPSVGFSGASSLSISRPDGQNTIDTTKAIYTGNNGHPPISASEPRISSQLDGLHLDQGDERVVWHGFLSCLRSKGGVRQWKKLWVVLRPKNLAFYKNEEVRFLSPVAAFILLTSDQEYAARLLIPLSSIISAVEIDPISKSKRYCMQIITEEKTYRFCAPNEEALDKWLGSLKSQVARRKENNRKRVASGPGP